MAEVINKINLMSGLKLLCYSLVSSRDCMLSWWYPPAQEAGYITKSRLINLLVLLVWALCWHHRRQQEGCRGKRMLMNQQCVFCGMRKISVKPF